MTDVFAWWADHQGQNWDPDEAVKPGHGGQPSDYNLFFDLISDTVDDTVDDTPLS